MADESKKDTSDGTLAKDKVTAPVPNQPSDDEADDTTKHTGRQKKYDGGDIPRSSNR